MIDTPKMTKPFISIIVAHSRNMAIGKGNSLLWRLPEDLKRFKKLTINHPIIMGRKTYESIGRPLPERTNLVVTRDLNLEIPGCSVSHSLDEAIRKAQEIDQEEIFIIGGEKIYKESLPLADRLYATQVDTDTVGDTFFPEYSKIFTKETFREKKFDTQTGLKYTWLILER